MQNIHWHRRAVLTAMAALAAQPTTAMDVHVVVHEDPFALGVASGDPAPGGFVLWTRLVGKGGSTLDRGAISVGFEVAHDSQFRRIVRKGEQVAHPAAGHSVHVELAGLDPDRRYWYRFHALGAVSPTGRTATAPLRADRFRLALTSCQHWELGWFSAYRDMIAADPDLIVQVGDYIYEQSYPDLPKVRAFGADDPRNLEGYRARHALYRTDSDLQEAHRLFPWLVTWDDHEVWNDYAGLANREGLAPHIFAARRAAAYQAYFEHMPIRPQPVAGPVDAAVIPWCGLGRSGIAVDAGYAAISVLAALRRSDAGTQCQAGSLRRSPSSRPFHARRSARILGRGPAGARNAALDAIGPGRVLRAARIGRQRGRCVQRSMGWLYCRSRSLAGPNGAAIRPQCCDAKRRCA